jgi:hypothetical protein
MKGFVKSFATSMFACKMRTRQRLVTAAVVALASVQGMCATTYQLQMNRDSPDCNQFLDIVKSSRIGGMSDQELCDAINKPVTEILPDAGIRELDWTQDPSADIATVAKKTVEAAEPPKLQSPSTKPHALWLQEVMKLDAAHQVKVAYSRVRLAHNEYYVVRLTESVCDAGYNRHGPLPIFGFFSDSAHFRGVPNPPLLIGQLIYFKGHLASFSLTPAWIWDRGSKKPRIFVSMQSNVEDTEKGSLRSGLKESCTILIQK